MVGRHHARGPRAPAHGGGVAARGGGRGGRAARGRLGQLARLAFPVGVGAQGVLLERGYDAVRISGDGELPDGTGIEPEEVDRDRLAGLGRAALRSLTALDAGPRPEHGPATYVTAVSQVVPGWVLSLLSLTLILPALVASVDAFARARRRRVAVRPWLTLGRIGLRGAAARAGPRPRAGAHRRDSRAARGARGPGRASRWTSPAAAVLAGIALVVGLSWLGLRRLALARDPALADRRGPGRGGGGDARAVGRRARALAAEPVRGAACACRRCTCGCWARWWTRCRRSAREWPCCSVACCSRACWSSTSWSCSRSTRCRAPGTCCCWSRAATWARSASLVGGRAGLGARRRWCRSCGRVGPRRPMPDTPAAAFGAGPGELRRAGLAGGHRVGAAAPLTALSAWPAVRLVTVLRRALVSASMSQAEQP